MTKKKERVERSREERKAEKERKRLIKEANRMLISAPKKSANSMGFLSFDPSGAFCFDGGRWVKVFEVTGSIKDAVKAALKVKSRIRITERIAPAKGESHTARAFVSLIAEGDIYEPVREQFEEDEVILQEMIGVRSLTVDEAIKVILMQLGGEKRSFSYASFVRAKRDLLKEISPEIVEERDHFQIEGSFGMTMFFMEYPDEVSGDTLSLLKELGCPVFVTFDLVGISDLDKEDYVRTLEKRYSRTLNRDSVQEFLNVSGQLTFLCDSKDAMEIIKKTVNTIFARAGFLISPVFGGQKDSFLSQISLGLLDYKNLRNVGVETMNEIFRREYGGNQNEVRADEDV